MTSIIIDRTDGLSSAVAIKGPCRVATTAAIVHAGEQTIDGVSVVVGDRVFDKDSTPASERGIWVVDTGPWRRAKDFSRTDDVVAGSEINIVSGAVNSGRKYILTTTGSINIGTTNLAFVQSGLGINDVTPFMLDVLKNSDDAGDIRNDLDTAVVVDTLADLKLLDTAKDKTARFGHRLFMWSGASAVTQINAVDPRYVAPNADITGDSGAWIEVGAVPTGEFNSLDGARIHRFTDRVFIGTMAKYGGEWAAASLQTGLDPLQKALTGWGPREGTVNVGAMDGSMAIVGYAQASHQLGGDGLAEWPGLPANVAAIGVSGFAIGDRLNSPAWGGYFDAINISGSFTVAQELAIANAAAEGTTITPFNILTGGAQAGVGSWVQSGNGLDVAWTEYDTVKSVSAYQVFLSSYRPAGGRTQWTYGHVYIVGRTANEVYADDATAYVCLVAHTAPTSGTFAAYRAANPTHWALRKDGDWVTATAYNVGDYATDIFSKCTFRCTVAHTSSGGVFSTYRTANATHWKQLPAAKAGLVIAAGALEEVSPGTNLYTGIRMPARTQVEWGRMNGATYESAAVIQAEIGTAGSSVKGLSFNDNGTQVLGGGVQLANTDVATTTVLDHYLEATQTLGVAFGGASVGVTFTSRTMSSTRIGDRITINASFQLSSKGSSVGIATITGLPVTASGNGAAMVTGYYQNFAAGITTQPMGVVSGTTIALYKAGAGTATAMMDTDFNATNTRLDFSITYKV